MKRESMVSPPSQSSIEREKRGDSKMVDWDEFCDLVISRRALVRSDDFRRRERRLYEPATGITFILDRRSIRSLG